MAKFLKKLGVVVRSIIEIGELKVRRSDLSNLIDGFIVGPRTSCQDYSQESPALKQ